MKRLADYVMERLFDAGAKHVFFVPGSGCMHLTDALKRKTDIVGIPMHHEQAAAMAALSYAKYNQDIGACLVTTGCGGTNTMTGLLHAWQDSVPCVFISGQAQRNHTIRNSGLKLRQKGRQEADIISIVSSITKYAVMVNEPKDIARHIDEALYWAKNGRPGPVWIDIPLDVQNSMIEEAELIRYKSNDVRADVDIVAVDSVVNAIENAERPLVLMGQGIRLAKALPEFYEFIDKINIPCASTRLGVDILAYEDPRNVGMVGMLGASRAGNFAIANCDLLLVVGSRLSVNTTGYEFKSFAENAKIIVIDIDEEEHKKDTVKIDEFYNYDIKLFLSELNNKELKICDSEWLKKCSHWKHKFPLDGHNDNNDDKVNLYDFVIKLSALLHEDACVLSDAGSVIYTVPSALRIKKGQRSIASGGQAEMGFSLPGSIGACYARAKKEVIAITGDGSLMMNIQELQTLSHNKLPIKLFIINNNGYDCIRNMQKTAFRRSIGTCPQDGLGFPDFEKVASCFELDYVRIETADSLDEKLVKIMNMNGPVLCEVSCQEDLKVLMVSTKMNKNKRFFLSRFEDLWPFLDKKAFIDEMIVQIDENSI